MEIGQLQAFVEVAERGHFGDAAAAIHVTQPAISQRIKQLERELGCELFHRFHRGVSLTDAGRALLPFARTIVREERRAYEAVRAVREGASGVLRVGYFGPGNPILPLRLVEYFRARYSGVTIVPSEGPSSANARQVAADELDVAFVRLPLTEFPSLEVLRIHEEPYVLALPRSHRLASAEEVRLADLAGERWITFPRHMNARQYEYLAEMITRASGEEMRVVLQAPSEEAMVLSVAQEQGICLCSQSRSRQLTVDGVVFKPLVPAPMAQLGLIASRSRPPSTAARHFVALAQTLASDGEYLTQLSPAR